MGLLAKFRTFRQNASKGLFIHVLEAISWATPEWVFAYFHSLLLVTNDPRVTTRPHDAYFKRFATVDDIPLMSPFKIPADVARRRLQEGDQCIIMGRDSDILSIIWACSSERYLKFSGAILDPGKDGVIFYGGFTKEEARLKGFFPTSFLQMYDHYRAQGRCSVYAAVLASNVPSLKLHKRMRFKEIGETYFLTILGFSICYYKSWPHPTSRIHIFFRRPPRKLFWV